MKNKIKIPGNQIRAALMPESYNSEKNTVEVTWTTGARVKRWSWDGPFHEELSVNPRHIRMERLRAGAPVLNHHGTGGLFSSGGLRDIMGVVEKASIKDGKGVATLRLSNRPDVADLVDDIKSGIIRNVSVGYAVHEFEELDEEAEDGSPVLRAIDWEPMEISFVGMPADMHSQVRDAKSAGEMFEATVKTREASTMKIKKQKGRASADESADVAGNGGEHEENQNSEPKNSSDESPSAEPGEALGGEQGGSGYASSGDSEGGEKSKPKPAVPSPVPGSVLTEDHKQREAQQREVTRQSEIRRAVRAAGLDEGFADELVESLVSADSARQRIFRELEKMTGSATRNSRVEVNDVDQQTRRRDAAVRALLHRYDPSKYQMKDGDREFRQGSLIDLARHYLHLSGVRDAYSMSRSELAKRALLTTSDFPELLAQTGSRTLLDAYNEVPSTFMPFTADRNVSDFRNITSMEMGNGGKLEAVGEHGEYKRTSMVESAESYKLGKFGLIVGRTWELIVNDDIGAFTQIPARLGRRAREKENEVFWSLVLGNPVMADGIPLFHASHGNLGATGAITPTTLGEGRTALRLQTDLDGEITNMQPKYLVVPAALEFAAESVVAPIAPALTTSVNPFAGKLAPVVEPRIDAVSATRWYLFADKNQGPMAERARLDGKGPEFFTREGFEVDGIETKIRYVFGMKILSHRGFYRRG